MLIIAEKPSVARKIAEFLSKGKYKKITYTKKVKYYRFYLNGSVVNVVSALGHLYTLSDYSGSWNYPTFNYRWVPAYHEDKIYIKRQYIRLLESFKNEKDIIIATDFDIEGELIGYNILRFVFNRHNAKRMIFSAITPKDIFKAFYSTTNIHKPFAIAGETRHIVDWIYGINLSRALTKAIRRYIKGVTLSIGRVQGPTLKLVFEREQEIRNFVPEEFYTLKVQCMYKGYSLIFQHPIKFKSKEDASKIKSKIGKTLRVLSVSRKIEKIPPPHPYNLTDLQTDAYKYYRILPKTTLQIAQKLYEQGYISYPRTSSQKLPETIDFRYILQNLSKMIAYERYTKELLKLPILKPNNGKKDDVHPAIHPTGILPRGLSKQEYLIYDLIVRRFIATFMEPMVIINIKVITEHNLEYSYKRLESLGWGIMYYRWLKNSFLNIDIKDKDILSVERVSIRKGKTKPPSRYNPASLVKKMEEINIGTKATRADVVNILFKRGYISGRSIRITELGEEIISIFDKYMPEILDINTTRDLENKLNKIEKGDIDYSKEVINEAKNMIIEVSKKLKIKEEEIGRRLAELYRKLNSKK